MTASIYVSSSPLDAMLGVPVSLASFFVSKQESAILARYYMGTVSRVIALGPKMRLGEHALAVVVNKDWASADGAVEHMLLIRLRSPKMLVAEGTKLRLHIPRSCKGHRKRYGDEMEFRHRHLCFEVLREHIGLPLRVGVCAPRPSHSRRDLCP